MSIRVVDLFCRLTFHARHPTVPPLPRVDLRLVIKPIDARSTTSRRCPFIEFIAEKKIINQRRTWSYSYITRHRCSRANRRRFQIIIMKDRTHELRQVS